MLVVVVLDRFLARATGIRTRQPRKVSSIVDNDLKYNFKIPFNSAHFDQVNVTDSLILVNMLSLPSHKDLASSE